MSRHPPASGGYTMVEMMVSLLILGVVVAGATGGWVYMVRGERLNSVQSELDMDVRKSMEQMKRDLRLSALDKMVFYPPGSGPYTAISFPMARDDNNDGLIEMTAGGSNILWDTTVIYHVWTGTPTRLLKTIFDPRDNTLTDAKRAEQLGSVAAKGNGKSTYGSANANTYQIFENLFTLKLWPKSSSFDGYNTVLDPSDPVSFGSILLTNGMHTFKFTVTGKNPASGGYYVGIDTLTVSPCGSEREAEAQLPATSQAGATAAIAYPAGGWSANSQLFFPATGTGATFTLTMENDRWEETNFKGRSTPSDRIAVVYDDSLKDYVVRLEGNEVTWTADGQTGDIAPRQDYLNGLAGCAVRMPIRGRYLLQNGGTMRVSGQAPAFLFCASDYGNIHIKKAYIAEAANHSNQTMNAAAAGTPLYFSTWPQFGSYSRAEVDIPYGNYWYASPTVPFSVDANKTYLVTLLIDLDDGNAPQWRETHSGSMGSWMIMATNNPTASDAQAADWSAKPVVGTNILCALWKIYTYYPTNGVFTSKIFDTKMSMPPYLNIKWNAEKPTGTTLLMKVRTGAQEDMSDAPDWATVSAMTTSPADLNPGNKRYIQFQSLFTPDNSGNYTPKLKDVTIRWTGETKIVDIGAVMAQGPNYGVVDLTVDGVAPTKGIRIDLSIFESIQNWSSSTSKYVVSSATAEVEPRNTGK